MNAEAIRLHVANRRAATLSVLSALHWDLIVNHPEREDDILDVIDELVRRESL